MSIAQNPEITAVITTYNRFELVQRAINSVLAQTYLPLEVIIIEDGSDSGLAAWLQSKNLTGFRYICHECNRGLAAARNTAFKAAQGDYIAYLDDDDEWKPERIEKQVHLLSQLTVIERKRLGVIYCGIEVIYPEEEWSTIYLPCHSGNLRQSIIKNGISTLSSTFLFSKAALRVVNGFDEGLPSSIDHDIWMKLAACNYHVEAVNEPLVVTYRQANRKSMMNDVRPRIFGVRMFTEKWMPVYQEWLGEVAGVSYSQRYFARVISRLAAERLVVGDFLGSWRAILEIFRYSHQFSYNCTELIKSIAIFIGKWLISFDRLQILRRLRDSLPKGSNLSKFTSK